MNPEIMQPAFVAGFLGGIIGGGMLLLSYIMVSRAMYKKRHGEMVAERKKEIARIKHLADLDKNKKKKKRGKG